MKITSSVFGNREKIPSKYTCDGGNINPELLISDVPEGAKSLALIMDDPDVPKAIHPEGIWVHWIMWNISIETKVIAENSAPDGAVVGANSRGNNKYAGPCPPDREHRYFFKLYALDTTLDLPVTTGKEGLLQATEGHVIGSAELIGLYERI
ncbi:MAG: YbhB/YbcL family Raf kinase inhibitor-like protein [Patescibacteria group bacterium]